MRKLLLAAALLLIALGSWSFFPKTAEPSGYMMVTGVGRTTGMAGFSASVITTNADGTQNTEELDGKALMASSKGVASSFGSLHAAELKKINQLRAQGWRVVSVTQNNSFQGVVNETTYLLEKQ